MTAITVRPRGEHWAVAVVADALAIKIGDFRTRADAAKAARVVSQVLGVEFTP
jgi:hypothetical protein